MAFLNHINNLKQLAKPCLEKIKTAFFDEM